MSSYEPKTSVTHIALFNATNGVAYLSTITTCWSWYRQYKASGSLPKFCENTCITYSNNRFDHVDSNTWSGLVIYISLVMRTAVNLIWHNINMTAIEVLSPLTMQPPCVFLYQLFMLSFYCVILLIYFGYPLSNVLYPFLIINILSPFVDLLSMFLWFII